MRQVPSLVVLPAALVCASGAYGAEYLTIPAAQRALFPEARQFVDASVQLSDEQRDEIRRLSGVRQRFPQQAVWRAKRDDELLGWVIVDNVIGKHEFITYAAGISPAGRVVGIEVLVYRETYGSEIRRSAWRDQFRDKVLTDAFKLDQDVTNLSGATLSCRSVTDGVKRLLALQQVALRS
jgi:Na+-translocating ferredoxin:NAD+ oxidoreductase RnfG subunit